MITDKIENIAIYKNIPQEVVDFINSLNPKIELGKRVINDKIYANIEAYNTKLISDCRFEGHENYIDIQLLLSGSEDIYYTQKASLNIFEPYDNNRDIAFYSENVISYPKVNLDGKNFMMIFPHEAHAPQAAIDNVSSTVKKVVVKIPVENVN